jgi:hypothetical protein
MTLPPDKWALFSTSGLTEAQIQSQLNQAVANGYTGQAIVIPVPGATDGSCYVAVAGYGTTTED